MYSHDVGIICTDVARISFSCANVEQIEHDMTVGVQSERQANAVYGL